MRHQRSIRDVVVIGAGVAGLTAAFELEKAGYRVRVLEARHRPGGRIRTLHEPFADGMYADAGAMFVPDCHELLLKYIDEFDLPLQIMPSRQEPVIYHLRGRTVVSRPGRPVDWPIALTAEERRLGLGGMIVKYLAPVLKTIGNPSAAGWPPAAARKLDRMSGAQFLQGQGASPAAIRLLDATIMGLFGDGLRDCSALFLLVQQALTAYTNVFAIRGGTERLPEAFASRLTGQIHYGKPVLRIEQRRSRVRVVFREEPGEDAVDADFVVCTVPFPILRHIVVRPQLSARKRHVVERLQNTSVVRVYLQCQTRFWETLDPSGTAFTDLGNMCLFPAYPRPGRRGVLEAYFAGPAARRLSAMTEPARVRFATRQMSRVFQALPRQIEHGVSQCWDNDPWARGAYAWYRPGEFLAFQPHLATPEGRIHFAGDHTSNLPGWIEGAMGSALRAVREIQARG